MKILKTTKEMQEVCREFRQMGKKIGLVPTMGALHAGHVSLVKAASTTSDVVAVSIFVNPTQFGPNEDFSSYPRRFEQDCALLEKEGVDFAFTPDVTEMYRPGSSTFVIVEGLSDRLDGASRPGHFRGVTTVVSKLLHIVAPHYAFFGQKDAAQVAVLRKMILDLNMDVRLVVCPIVREPDGLALSSRNVYLDSAQRGQALVLNRAIAHVQKLAAGGERSAQRLLSEAHAIVSTVPQVRLDYLVAVNPETLEDVADLGGGAMIAIAAYFGPTRLIDNAIIPPSTDR